MIQLEVDVLNFAILTFHFFVIFELKSLIYEILDLMY